MSVSVDTIQELTDKLANIPFQVMRCCLVIDNMELCADDMKRINEDIKASGRLTACTLSQRVVGAEVVHIVQLRDCNGRLIQTTAAAATEDSDAELAAAAGQDADSDDGWCEVPSPATLPAAAAAADDVRKCYNCGATGHTRAQCPDPKHKRHRTGKRHTKIRK